MQKLDLLLQLDYPVQQVAPRYGRLQYVQTTATRLDRSSGSAPLPLPPLSHVTELTSILPYRVPYVLRNTTDPPFRSGDEANVPS